MTKGHYHITCGIATFCLKKKKKATHLPCPPLPPPPSCYVTNFNNCNNTPYILFQNGRQQQQPQKYTHTHTHLIPQLKFTRTVPYHNFGHFSSKTLPACLILFAKVENYLPTFKIQDNHLLPILQNASHNWQVKENLMVSPYWHA